ncbi:MAG: GYD domain-containing protein [Salinigranum sp.]
MSLYVVLADVNEREFQNAQEFVNLWGSVRSDLAALEADLVDTYALLGGYDFLVTLEADDKETAMEASLLMERQGLDAETMQALPVDHLGELVDDV